MNILIKIKDKVVGAVKKAVDSVVDLFGGEPATTLMLLVVLMLGIALVHTAM